MDIICAIGKPRTTFENNLWNASVSDLKKPIQIELHNSNKNGCKMWHFTQNLLASYLSN